MRANRIVTLAIALLFVISIAVIPAAESLPQAWASFGRPDPLIAPSAVFQNLPRIEWRKELPSPNEPFGGSEFYFLPYLEPESFGDAPFVGEDWC
jgi:hypothetical protein